MAKLPRERFERRDAQKSPFPRVYHPVNGFSGERIAAAYKRSDALAKLRRKAVETVQTVQADKPDKGKKDGSCNRGACQRPGAVFFNLSTRAYYCPKCAHDIDQFAVSERAGRICYTDEELDATNPDRDWNKRDMTRDFPHRLYLNVLDDYIAHDLGEA
jgi:hypothetical protein